MTGERLIPLEVVRAASEVLRFAVPDAYETMSPEEVGRLVRMLHRVFVPDTSDDSGPQPSYDLPEFEPWDYSDYGAISKKDAQAEYNRLQSRRAYNESVPGKAEMVALLADLIGKLSR